MMDNDIQELLFDVVRRGTPDPDDADAIVYDASGRFPGVDNVRVIVMDSGRIRTGYPASGANVWSWQPAKGWVKNPTPPFKP